MCKIGIMTLHRIVGRIKSNRIEWCTWSTKHRAWHKTNALNLLFAFFTDLLHEYWISKCHGNDCHHRKEAIQKQTPRKNTNPHKKHPSLAIQNPPVLGTGNWPGNLLSLCCCFLLETKIEGPWDTYGNSFYFCFFFLHGINVTGTTSPVMWWSSRTRSGSKLSNKFRTGRHRSSTLQAGLGVMEPATPRVGSILSGLYPLPFCRFLLQRRALSWLERPCGVCMGGGGGS